MTNKKAKGKRAKTRDKFRKRTGKASVSRLLQDVPEGARVEVNINPSIHSGMPMRRFQGAVGTVGKARGRAICVDVVLGNKPKEIIVHPAHLKVISTGVKQ